MVNLLCIYNIVWWKTLQKIKIKNKHVHEMMQDDLLNCTQTAAQY